MPKIKTKSSVKKRFKLTSRGKIKRSGAFTRHMMRNKPKSMKRKARGMTTAAQADAKRILRWLPNASRQRKRKNTQPNHKPEHKRSGQES